MRLGFQLSILTALAVAGAVAPAFVLEQHKQVHAVSVEGKGDLLRRPEPGEYVLAEPRTEGNTTLVFEGGLLIPSTKVHTTVVRP